MRQPPGWKPRSNETGNSPRRTSGYVGNWPEPSAISAAHPTRPAHLPNRPAAITLR